MNNDKLKILAQQYLSGKASEEEAEQLHQWYNNWADDEEIVATSTAANDEEAVRSRILQQLQQKIVAEKQQKTNTVPFYRKKGYVAAASIILLMGSIFYFTNYYSKTTTATVGKPALADVAAPQNTKAMITLANGRQVALDSLNTGLLVKEGSVKISKTADGQIVYEGASAAVEYNTLFNPRKSNIVNIQLNDGTKVWLNSQSSLRYPTVFNGSQRRVEITGEAYFEVAKNEQMPFIVSVAGKQEVEVLGTHFNINAYTDEESVNTTLLEGKVKVTSVTNTTTQFLLPLQQSRLLNSGAISVNKQIDAEEIMAWKNNLFQFESASLQSILRQFARWYDIEVEYKGKISGRKFFVIMNRSSSLAQVLKALQANGINFTIESNKLTVKND